VPQFWAYNKEITNTLRHEERKCVVEVYRVPTLHLNQVATYAKAAHIRSFARRLKAEQDNFYLVVTMPRFSVVSHDTSTSTRNAHVSSRILVCTHLLGFLVERWVCVMSTSNGDEIPLLSRVFAVLVITTINLTCNY
jgi:hypothetical protein